MTASRTALEAAIRQQVLVRVLAATVVSTGALLPALERPSTGWVLVAAAAVVEVVAALALARYVGALRKGDRGELLLQLGARIPVRVLRATQQAEQLEALTFGAIAVVGVLLVSPAHTAGAWAIGCLEALLLGLLIVMVRVRVLLRALHESVVALCAMDVEGAERWLARVEAARAPAWRRLSRPHRQTLRLWRGDVDATHAEMEADWSGALDQEGANVAIARLGTRGDTQLARRWLEANPGDNRYSRWQRASIAGQVALVERRWEDALAAAADPGARDVPDYFLRQLDLVSAAALRGAGRDADADRVIAGLDPPLDREAWRARAFPLMWTLLGGTAAPPAPLPRAPLRAPTTPFAPPETHSRAPARPVAAAWRGTGAVPVEPIVVAPSHRLAVTQAIGTAGMLILGPSTLLSGVILAGVASLSVGLSTAALGAYFTLTGVVRLAGWLPSDPRATPRIALGDDRTVSASTWRWLAWRSASPFLNVVVLVIALLPLAEGFSTGWWTGWLVALPLIAIYGWAGMRRYRLLRAIGAVHFLPVGEARKAAEACWAEQRPGRNPSRTWLALARLWDGDAAGAERVALEEKELDPTSLFVLRWLQAGRGEVDLDRMIAAPELETTGDRYRAAVALAVAALRAGSAERVLGRCDEWLELAGRLPNRYGALLARLVTGVRRACGRTVEQADDPELAWVATVWPFIP